MEKFKLISTKEKDEYLKYLIIEKNYEYEIFLLDSLGSMNDNFEYLGKVARKIEVMQFINKHRKAQKI